MERSTSATLADVFDLCLDQLAAGATVVECLARHPEHADALAPLLLAAAQVRQVPPPPLSSATRERVQRLARTKLVQPRRPHQWLATPYRAVFYIGLALLLVLVVGSGTLYAAERSLPGDLLYPVKRATEELRLGITRDPAERAEVYLTLAERRADELQQLVQAQKPLDAGALDELLERYRQARETMVVDQPGVVLRGLNQQSLDMLQESYVLATPNDQKRLDVAIEASMAVAAQLGVVSPVAMLPATSTATPVATAPQVNATAFPTSDSMPTTTPGPTGVPPVATPLASPISIIRPTIASIAVEPTIASPTIVLLTPVAATATTPVATTGAPTSIAQPPPGTGAPTSVAPPALPVVTSPIPLPPTAMPTAAAVVQTPPASPAATATAAPTDAPATATPVLPTATSMPVVPGGPLDRAGWQVETWNGRCCPDRMVDADTGSVWNSGEIQQPGQWIVVDMRQIQRFDGLQMDSTTSFYDYAYGFVVQVSGDANQWSEPIAYGNGTQPVIDVDFTEQYARYIRVTLTRPAGPWWSINDFSVTHR